MTLDSRSVETVLHEVKNLLAQETSLSPALRAAWNGLLALVAALLQRLNLHSRNSSKPPSTDPNRPKSRRPKGQRPPGGQNGHVGTTLQPVDEPDVIRVLAVGRSTLPEGDYRPAGFEKRQVFDLDIALVVTEYRAEILADSQGRRFTAPFPAGVSSRVQYGPAIKALRSICPSSSCCLITGSKIISASNCRFRSAPVRCSTSTRRRSNDWPHSNPGCATN